jgi:hypothetical protein
VVPGSERRELGHELLGLFLAAIGADSIFFLCGNGLQQYEVLSATIAHIFIERHFKSPFLVLLTVAPLPCTESVENNTHGTEPCQAKYGEHQPDKTVKK